MLNKRCGNDECPQIFGKSCMQHESVYQSCENKKASHIKIKPFFRWFDLWIGVYIDKPRTSIYICPIPMFGVKIYRT